MMNLEKKPMIILAGPTGSGKSELAIKLCRIIGMDRVEIIAADSRQIYRGMNIGTDKPAMDIRRLIPHHLLDIADPSEQFSAADFRRLALDAADRIQADGRIPLVVGGTGLYLRALRGGLADVPKADPVLRDRLVREAQAVGSREMHERLAELDPIRAAQIQTNDTYRIIRALEIIRTQGNAVSDRYASHAFADSNRPNILFILNMERSKLYKRIDRRVDRMIQQGLVDEVTGLYDRFGEDAPGLNAIGYTQIIELIQGRISLVEAVLAIKRDSRRYAKRQMTWFRKEPEAGWIDHDPDHPEISLGIIGRNIGVLQG